MSAALGPSSCPGLLLCIIAGNAPFNTTQGLDILAAAGVFEVHPCKLCGDGVVVKGEYALSQTILGAGFNVATLMRRYRPVSRTAVAAIDDRERVASRT